MSPQPAYVPHDAELAPRALPAGVVPGLPRAEHAAVCAEAECDRVFDGRFGRCQCGSSQYVSLGKVLDATSRRNARIQGVTRALDALAFDVRTGAQTRAAIAARLEALVRELQEVAG